MCVCACVLGQPALFLHSRKKIQNFLVGWLLAHTPPSFLFFFFGLLATHIYITQKMYILGNKGFSFFFFSLSTQGW